jgi:hypothetical protein
MNRPLQRLLKIATLVAIPAALLALTPIAGQAGVSDPTHPTPMPPTPMPPPPPPPLIYLPDLIAWEKVHNSCPPPALVVGLSHATDVPVSVTLSTADGSAHAPDDYAAITGLRVTIPAGALSAAVPVRINADTVQEPNEFFTATISSPAGGEIRDGVAVVTIENGQQPPTC